MQDYIAFQRCCLVHFELWLFRLDCSKFHPQARLFLLAVELSEQESAGLQCAILNLNRIESLAEKELRNA